MSAQLSKSLPLPPSSLTMDDVKESEKQGIVSILRCDAGRARATSLRCMLSADMLSEKWLPQNGFHPMKKIVPSEELLVSIEDSSSSDDEEDNLKKDVEGCGQLYIWKSMKETLKGVQSERSGECNTWDSILFQKVEDSKSLPPPYTHPLVKKSAGSLSGRSLEICTESLGSETGSDGFSSYPASEVGDMEVEDCDVEEFYGVKNYQVATRKTRPQSFPPPIQSLSQGNGGSLSMHSCRNNGRLVLEVVSVPLDRNFEAQREDGRLVLTFANNDQSYHEDEEEEINEEEEDEFVMEMDEDILTEQEEEETEENDVEEGVEFDRGEVERSEFAFDCIPKLSSGVRNVHKLPQMLNKSIASLNRNPAWQRKCNEGFNYEEDEEEEPILLEQSLPVKSPVAWMLSTRQSAPATATAPVSMNCYEYFWRTKSPATSLITLVTQPLLTLKGHTNNYEVTKNLQSNESQESQLQRRKNGYLDPLLTSCNSPSRCNLLWEPKCIATS